MIVPVDPVPAQYGSVTASLTVSPCADAIQFYAQVFGAVETARMTGPDGRVAHAEIRIGDSIVMLADESPDGPTRSPRTAGATTAVMFVYTDDVDAMWERAIAAGASEIYPLEHQFYGDKGGRIEDPFGHQWGLAQHVEDVTPEEMERRTADYFSP